MSDWEIDINVRGSFTGMLAPDDGNQDRSQGALVKMGFLLNDTLKVMDEDEVMMTQCCYEQKIIHIYSSWVDNRDFVRQLAYNTLCEDMNMDQHLAEKAKAEVARTITELVQQTRYRNPSFWTVLLEVHVHVGSMVEKDHPTGAIPLGEHGYPRLLERRDDEVCEICEEEFISPGMDIIITPCHHTYHRSCVSERMYGQSRRCPVCQSNLAPLFGGRIEF